MSDSDAEKTEAPTERKRKEALDEGRIPRSPELGTAALFLGAAFTLSVAAPAVSSRVLGLFATGLRTLGDRAWSEGSAVSLLQNTGREMVTIIATLGAGLAGMALFVGALQARGVFSMKPLEPKWERLDPMANASRMIGIQPIAELVKSLLKMLIVGWAVWHVLSAAWPDLIDLSDRDPMSLFDTVQRYAVSLLKTAGLAYFVLAVCDYGYQWWQYVKNMRMTKDEVRQESKQQDGDPMFKSRIRAVARARMRRQMFRDVAKADVVIVNPTHIAIALIYDPLQAPAPIVLAMGERKVAERIKQLAYQHNVPVLQNKPLARALLASARIGSMIPAELYAAVAEVLAFVIRQRTLRGNPSRWNSGVTV
jgi:flagellar biosynthetic protein FlhB